MTARESSGATLVARRIAALRAQLAPAPAARAANAAETDASAATTTDLPDYVTFALARWRQLNDIPFRYLVPDARLLPDESIRFFTLDSDWLDALSSGALMSGGGGTREIAQAQAALPGSLVAAARLASAVRDVLRGRLSLSNLPAPPTQSTGVVSGFLLRSALVSGWPGMQVRAWSSDDPSDVPPEVDPSTLAARRPDLVVPILRLEQLSLAVMIVLFDGVPKLIWLEEPHHGVQYGVDEAGAAPRIIVRNESGQDTTTTIPVPMRTGGLSGVVDIAALARSIDTTRPLPHARGSGALALQLLHAPTRQRFSVSAAGGPP